jgi:two-component system, OmpR family, sensor kinase
MSGVMGIARCWRRLDVRLALVVVISLGMVGVALLAWQENQAQHRQDKFIQWQSLHLARYIADRQSVPLIDDSGQARAQAMANTAMYIGMIHPSIEAYVLDRDGRILLRSDPHLNSEMTQVNLRTLQPLLANAAPELPIYGDDPRAPGKSNLVSIAAIPNAKNTQGYLYIVLQGEKARLVQQLASTESQRDSAWGIILLALAIGACVIMAVQMNITSRLRRLAAQLQEFRQPDGKPLFTRATTGDEIDLVTSVAETLQTRVQLQFKRLEDNDRLRRELVSNISHDLHTPLANIQGYVETLLLRGEQLAPEMRHQHLNTILHHCRSLGRRVAELFELSKLESGQTQAHIEPFQITELLNDVVHSHQLEAEQRGITLRLSEKAERHVQVLADIGLIERVLQNLVDNALRHTTRGGLVELSVGAEAGRVQVRVSDNGQGIPKEDLPHIFERYWTTHICNDDVARPSTSMGLGLAIVRRILDLHGSTIGVRSTLQQGTVFSFALTAVTV